MINKHPLKVRIEELHGSIRALELRIMLNDKTNNTPQPLQVDLEDQFPIIVEGKTFDVEKYKEQKRQSKRMNN